MGTRRAAAAAIGSVELTDTQEVDVELLPLDAKGNPAVIDGVAAWETSDATIATVANNPNDNTAVVRATGLVGSCKITATADADMGAGVEPIIGVLDVNVIAGKAVTVQLSAGDPREQTNASRASA